MRKTFVPTTDLARNEWLKNFSAKLSTYATKYGISNEEVQDIQLGSAFFSYWMDYRKQYEEYGRKLTAYKNELLFGIAPGATESVLPTQPTMPDVPGGVAAGIFKRSLSIANVIKSRVVYTKADGKDLGIEGAIVSIDLHVLQPVLKIDLVAGGAPLVKWIKQGMNAIEIYVDRNKGTWELLAIDLYPDHIDKEALPANGQTAVWRYKAIYRLNDKRVGQWSDPVSITVTGN